MICERTMWPGIDFLKRAREVRTGKTQKRRDARKKYVEKQLEKADFPFWW